MNSPLKEMNEVADDTIIARDHICAGSGAHEIERYPGPSDRLLTECRQACLDNGRCSYYAYWPANHDNKNHDGECKNNCRLYDTCNDHASPSAQITTGTCSSVILKLGTKSIASRPDYAKNVATEVQ